MSNTATIITAANISNNAEMYTFDFETAKTGKIRNYTGVIRVEANVSSEEGAAVDFKITMGKKMSDSLSKNIQTVLNEKCVFYPTYEECVIAHDEALIRESEGEIGTAARDGLLDKLLNQTLRPGKSQLEINALAWYTTLNEEQQSYLRWLKNYCDAV